MGLECSKCSVGNPCTDPKCNEYGSGYGSKHLRSLLTKVQDKFENLEEKVKQDEKNQYWLQEMDKKFENSTNVSTEGFKDYARNVREFFNRPQYKISQLSNQEYRLLVCLDSHKQGEYLECQPYVKDLMDVATIGRDHIAARCRDPSDSAECAFQNYEERRKTRDGGAGGSTSWAQSKTDDNGSDTQTCG